MSFTAAPASLMMGGIILPTLTQSLTYTHKVTHSITAAKQSSHLPICCVRLILTALMKMWSDIPSSKGSNPGRDLWNCYVSHQPLAQAPLVSLCHGALGTYLAHKLDKTQLLVVANLVCHGGRKNDHVTNIRNHAERLVVADLDRHTRVRCQVDLPGKTRYCLCFNVQQRIRR